MSKPVCVPGTHFDRVRRIKVGDEETLSDSVGVEPGPT